MNLDRNVRTSTVARWRLVVQPFKANDSALMVFDQDDVVADFLADRLLARIIKPDRDRIARSIVVDPYFVHNSCPFFKILGEVGGDHKSFPGIIASDHHADEAAFHDSIIKMGGRIVGASADQYGIAT